MCAICGIIDFSGKPVSGDEVVAMRDMMVHRGPDAGGLQIVNHSAGLGHRRLKIIDLSDEANQPMRNRDGSIWTVFNGEIYNFIELRSTLAQKGYAFRTRSDTEVIVHGYQEWEDDLWRRLDGMFAIALWDVNRGQLTLARDPYGQKPLFFEQRGSKLLFASDVKALWRVSDGAPALDAHAIDCFLHHFSPTQEHCIFRGVHKVQPGHYHKFTASGDTPVCYWRPSFRNKRAFTEPDALDALDGAFRKAVSKRLISDVPLGAFLSGGIDSSLVVAVMSQVAEGQCRTFSIGFEEQDFSELPYARAVAQRYGTRHEEIILRPEILKILPSLVWEYGEPFADSSAVPTYYVSRAARRFVTVALSGDGGDELFGGYRIANASYYSSLLNRVIPEAVRHVLENALFHPRLERVDRGVVHKLKTLLVHGSEYPHRRHAYSMAWNPEHKAHLYRSSFAAQVGDHAPWHIFAAHYPRIQGLHLIDQNLLLTIAGRLPNDYLVKIDVASMKSSLELRSPFLDRELSALSESIDPMLKVKRGIRKYLLKKLSERYLPHHVIYRQKRGFELPLTHWLQTSLAPVIEQLLLAPDGSLARRGWFDMQYVRRLFDEHRTRKHAHTHRLWSLLWLELWFRLFMDRSLQPGDSLEDLARR